MAKYGVYGNQAEELYVRQGLTLLEISRVLPVSQQTLSSWKSRYRWDEKRQEFRRTPTAAADRVADILEQQLEEISTKIRSGELSSVKAADTIAKLVASHQRVKKEEGIDILGTAPMVMHRFVNYLMNRDEYKELGEQLADVIPEFMDHLWERYRR